MSDRASKALAEVFLSEEPRTYDTISKRSKVPPSTLHHRAHGRRSKEQKAQSQQYLTPSEEKALEKFLKLISDLGNSVRIKFLPSLAFSIARQRSTTGKAIKPPGKNWAHFTSLYSPARERAFTKRNITAAWAASGLFPFNPDRVLRDTPKPSAQLIAPKANEIKVGSRTQDDMLQTPVTPVSVEALTSLHNLIKQDAHTLNKTSIQRQQRHVQKLANAAQISFAERALLHDQNQFLTRMNNEAKVRRSTNSVVLGKAKVMSYEDIEKARAKRAAKEVIKGKGKRGRKRKGAALEGDEPEPEPELEVARMIEAPEP
jgi:hypothetical protein